MSNDEKAPCPYCGELITTIKAARDSHLLACQKKQAMEKLQPSGIPVKDRELEADVERAKAIAERRRKDAPKILASGDLGPDMLTLRVNQLRKRGVIPDDQIQIGWNSIRNEPIMDYVWHTFWGEVGKRKMYVSDGYIPAVEDGVHERCGDVECYMIPREIPFSAIAANQRESKMRIDNEVKTAAASSAKLIANQG